MPDKAGDIVIYQLLISFIYHKGIPLRWVYNPSLVFGSYYMIREFCMNCVVWNSVVWNSP